MKKLLLILLCLPMIGFGQVKNNKSIFNFKKTNNYSKTYTYNSKATSYYVLSEIVDWECIQEGKSIKECTSFEKIYHFINGDFELECVEFDSLEWGSIFSARKGVKYKGELFTGTTCGHIDKKSGNTVEPINYIEGKMNGYHCEYYKNGNKAYEAYYENGKPKGKTYTMWGEDGTLYKRWKYFNETYFENGKPMKGKPYTRYKEDGTLLKRWEYFNETYFENRKPMKGTWKWWNEDGTLHNSYENKLWKDPQCNKKHIIDGSSWDGILKGGSECKCNLMDLWSSQYHKDTTTLVWKPYKKQ